MESSEEELAVALADVQLVDDTNPHTDICPTCGFTDWYVMQVPGRALPVLPMGMEDGSLFAAGTGHPLVALACQRCGHLRMHVKPIFDGYVRQLKEAKHDAG